MWKMLIKTICLFIPVLTCSAISAYFSRSKIKNKLFNNNVIFSHVSKSLLDCAGSCSELSVCLSLTYNMVTLDCHIYSSMHANEEGLNCLNTTFYIKKGFEQHCSSMGYIYRGDIPSCLKLYPIRQNHSTAEFTCASEGAELVKVDSTEMQNDVTAFLQLQENESVMESNNAFIQGHRLGTNNWIFNNGTSFNYFNWDASNPKSDITQEAVTLAVTTGEWKTVYKYLTRSFVCEIFV